MININPHNSKQQHRDGDGGYAQGVAKTVDVNAIGNRNDIGWLRSSLCGLRSIEAHRLAMQTELVHIVDGLVEASYAFFITNFVNGEYGSGTIFNSFVPQTIRVHCSVTRPTPDTMRNQISDTRCGDVL